MNRQDITTTILACGVILGALSNISQNRRIEQLQEITVMLLDRETAEVTRKTEELQAWPQSPREITGGTIGADQLESAVQ